MGFSGAEVRAAVGAGALAVDVPAARTGEPGVFREPRIERGVWVVPGRDDGAIVVAGAPEPVLDPEVENKPAHFVGAEGAGEDRRRASPRGPALEELGAASEAAGEDVLDLALGVLPEAEAVEVVGVTCSGESASPRAFLTAGGGHRLHVTGLGSASFTSRMMRDVGLGSFHGSSPMRAACIWSFENVAR